jgi:hypothetical protein
LRSSIAAARIDDTQPWRTKLKKTLEANYRRAQRFEATMELLVPLIDAPEDGLAAFNMNAVIAIAAHLGLATRFLKQSDLDHSGQATDLLVSLVQAAGGDRYLAGGGSSGYQVDEAFAGAGLGLVMQGFSPRPYGDPARFLPGLSVIDYLMQDGRPFAEAFPETSGC